MGAPLILRLNNKVNELDSRVNNKHEIFSGGLHGSNEGEEVSADLNGNVADYNFFICRVRKWSDSQEITNVIVSKLDEKCFYLLPSSLSGWEARFSIIITSDNKVKFQCQELKGWEYKDTIQLENVWGI